MKRTIILTLTALVCCCAQVQAQGILDRLAKGAKNAAENAAQRNIDKHIDNAVDNAFNKNEQQEATQENEATQSKSTTNGWTCPACGHEGNSGKFCGECGAKQPTGDGSWTCSKCGTTGNTGKFCNECGAQKDAANEAAKPHTNVNEYIKSDFVPGDEIIFEDLVEGEQLGEFPSKWDLERGNAEIAKVNGQQVIALSGDDSWITPLMKDGSKNYLGDVFTLEFDYMYDDREKDGAPSFELDFMAPDEAKDNEIYTFTFNFANDYQSINCDYVKLGATTNTDKQGSASKQDVGPLNDGKWHHYAVSFNKRALKFYVDGIRIINVPAAKAGAGWFTFWNGNGNANKPSFLKNVRVAKGAVPLYDRLSTDGKIITYAITFETGKADLKPESYVEINRIAQLMKDNPTFNFEVQGHCDNTGSDKINDPLSQKRAEAIVTALVGQGISADRLTSVGKGSHSPIADNSTDEGRAKNRRVEFIKK